MFSLWSSESLGSLCDQLLNIMTPGSVEKTSSTPTFHIGIPQGYMLSPLHSLFFPDYVAVHSSNTIIESRHHQDDNPDTLRLSIIKPKELIVDYRKQQVGGRTPSASGGQQWRILAVPRASRHWAPTSSLKEQDIRCSSSTDWGRLKLASRVLCNLCRWTIKSTKGTTVSTAELSTSLTTIFHVHTRACSFYNHI